MKLEKCLKKLEMDDLYEIYYFSDNVEEDVDDLSKDELIKKLIPILKNRFNQFIEFYNFETVQIMNDMKKNGYTNFCYDLFYDNGFLYFDDLNESKMIIPQEFIQIFNKRYTKSSQLKLLDNCIHSYLICDLIIPINFIMKEYVEKYNLDITEEDLLRIIKDYGECKNGYICALNLNDEDFVEIINNLKEHPTMVLSSQELNNQMILLTHILTEISTYMDKGKAFYLYILLSAMPTEDLSIEVTNACKSMGIKKHIEEIIKIFEENYSEIRFYMLGGRTVSEIIIDDIVKNCMHIHKKSITLEDCLKNITENHKLLLEHIYGTTNVSKLKKLIIDNFTEKAQTDMLEYNNCDIEYSNFDLNLYAKGIIYANNKKIVIPKEFVDIITNFNNKYKKITSNLSFDDLFKLIISIKKAIEYNGVIKKNKLQELLKNEGFDLEIDGLDVLIEKYDITTIKDFYTNSFDEDLLDEIEEISKKKDEFKIYKPISEYGDERDEIINYMCENFCYLYDDAAELILESVSSNNFSRNELLDILDFYDITISNKEKTRIYNYVNSVKDNIPIWSKNGYTNEEK